MTDEDVGTVGITSLQLEWFFVVRYFDEADEAKRAFDRMNEHAARLQGQAQLGAYRMLDGNPNAGGQPRIVAVVGSIEERVREAARMLGGLAYALPDYTVRALLLRRLRFLLAGNDLDAPAGVYTFEHGEGMALDEGGRPMPRPSPMPGEK